MVSISARSARTASPSVSSIFTSITLAEVLFAEPDAHHGVAAERHVELLAAQGHAAGLAACLPHREHLVVRLEPTAEGRAMHAEHSRSLALGALDLRQAPDGLARLRISRQRWRPAKPELGDRQVDRIRGLDFGLDRLGFGLLCWASLHVVPFLQSAKGRARYSC
jgi:hypothetical protein